MYCNRPGSIFFLTAILIVLFVTPLPAEETLISDLTVAKVEGTIITKGELDNAVSQIKKQAEKSGKHLDASEIAEIEKEALEKLINRTVLYLESKKDGIKVDETLVIKQLEKIKKQYPDKAGFSNELDKIYLSEAGFKSQIRQTMAIRDFIDNRFSKTIKISDEEIKKYYDSNPQFFKQPPKVKASHILVKVAPDADKSEKSKAMEKIKTIRQRVKKGEDFGTLAKEFSECPSKTKHGDLGYFGKGQMVKPFENTAFALQPLEVSDIVATRFGYHLIKVTDKQKESTVPLEKVKNKIKQFLKQNRVQSEVQHSLEKLKSEISIERFPEKKSKALSSSNG